MAMVLTCTEFDAGTGECTAQVWAEATPPFWDQLTIADAQQIAAPMAAAFALAWCFKQLFRQLDRT